MKKLPAYLSLVLCACLFVVYWLRPNWAAALTIFPVWIWLLLWLFALPARKSRLFLVVTSCWLLFALLQVEEWRSVLRTLIPVEQPDHSIQVTTINCSGSIKSLQDSFAEDPDIILVQESPGRDAMEELIKDKGGYECLYGIDTSIIAKGKLVEIYDAMFYKAGTAVIGEESYFVVSLRLSTSTPRVDLWKAASWKSQCYMRKRQMQQIAEVADILPDDAILIIGGDFNVPQGDKVFSLLSDRTEDTFNSGGRGWCNTIIADYPLLRIDQIWTSDELECFDASARKSPKTDHRLYTAKIKFEK